MQIKLIRHALSHLNAKLIKHHDMPNHMIPIVDPDGVNQALAVGKHLGKEYLTDALLYCSPYLRTRQTMNSILIGAGINSLDAKIYSNPRIYEDPRLREVDFGYGDYETQKIKREAEGHFWYRMDGGESAADCFDRSASFFESMMRQVERKRKPIINSRGNMDMENRNVIIVTHGMLVRCLVMRFMHLFVEQFDSIDTPDNCDIITIAHKEQIANPQFVTGKWAVEGLKMRS